LLKSIRCPKCKNITTVEGNSGDIKTVTCPNCGLKGNFRFPINKETSEIKKEKKKLIDIKKKIEPMPVRRVKILGIYFIISVPILLYILVATWPISGTSIDPGNVEYFHGLLTFELSKEARILFLVIISGALGAYIHFGTSFIYFAGKKELDNAFTAWYIIRPLLGASLAPIFYFVVRGLFFNTQTTLNDINLYSIIAISGLVGMFSKQAIEMLRKVFDDIFIKVENIEKKNKKN
jgi:hypothetical protein